MSIVVRICPQCKSECSILDYEPDCEDYDCECSRCFYRGTLRNWGSSNSIARIGTAYSPGFAKKFSLPGRLYVPASKQEFQLSLGKFILGKNVPDGDADIKIGDNLYLDVFMSKQNACIEVRKDNLGFDVLIRDIGATNPIKLNGRQLYRGDAIYLNGNDEITLGKTLIVFKEGDCNATIIKF